MRLVNISLWFPVEYEEMTCLSMENLKMRLALERVQSYLLDKIDQDDGSESRSIQSVLMEVIESLEVEPRRPVSPTKISHMSVREIEEMARDHVAAKHGWRAGGTG